MFRYLNFFLFPHVLSECRVWRNPSGFHLVHVGHEERIWAWELVGLKEAGAAHPTVAGQCSLRAHL